jgi:hypothetical protein
MSLTSVEAVAAHYPRFEKGFPEEKPSEAQIQAYIDSEAKRLVAIATARGYALDGLAATNPQGYALLSLANEIGAAAHLGEDLVFLRGSRPYPQSWANPRSLRPAYESIVAEFSKGTYDKLLRSDEPMFR